MSPKKNAGRQRPSGRRERDDLRDQGRPRRDAEGRRDHGRHHARAGEDRRGGGRRAVMALERVPADIRKEGGVARMAQISVIEAIQRTVSIPVMAKVRIGHFVEAQVLDALGVDFIDESEVLTPADETYHVDKHGFRSPFVCGARNLGEALRRIGEGAAMIRTKGEAGSGNIVEAVRHLRQVNGDIRAIQALRGDELATRAKELGAPVELVRYVHAARQAAGAELRGGRHRHAGGRRALHEPRRRGRVRGLGHLQERRPRGARPRRGARHHALEGAGRGARGLARARRGDGRASRSRRSPRTSGSRTGAGSRRRRSPPCTCPTPSRSASSRCCTAGSGASRSRCW